MLKKIYIKYCVAIPLSSVTAAAECTVVRQEHKTSKILLYIIELLHQMPTQKMLR